MKNEIQMEREELNEAIYIYIFNYNYTHDVTKKNLEQFPKEL